MTMLSRNVRTIFHQGEYDGACFLYAIANASYSLTGVKPLHQDWDEAMMALPKTRFFLCGHGGGTPVHYGTDTALLEETLRLVLDKFARADLKITAHPAIARVADLAPMIDRGSVALVCYQGDTENHRDLHHWAVGVGLDHDPMRLHLACSARYTEATLRADDEYQEYTVPETQMTANDAVSNFGRFALDQGTTFQISR